MIEARHSDTAPAPAPAAQRTTTEREVRYLRCPICDEMMTRMNFGKRSGVMLDACRRHGAWFDRGELSGALDFVEAGGLTEDLRSASARDEVAEAVMTSALETERVQQANAVAAATDFVDDLLFVLVPRDQYTAWGDRRRRRS